MATIVAEPRRSGPLPRLRGRAYAAHFALTHLFWLVTYPAVGVLAQRVGTPWIFTAAGSIALAATALAAATGFRGRQAPHP